MVEPKIFGLRKLGRRSWLRSLMSEAIIPVASRGGMRTVSHAWGPPPAKSRRRNQLPATRNGRTEMIAKAAVRVTSLCAPKCWGLVMLRTSLVPCTPSRYMTSAQIVWALSPELVISCLVDRPVVSPGAEYFGLVFYPGCGLEL